MSREFTLTQRKTLTTPNPPTSPRALLFAENLLGLLLAGGIGHQDAAWACDVLPLITTATAIETDVRLARGDSEDDELKWVDDLRRKFSSLPASQFPLLSSFADELTSGDGDKRFHFAVDALLDGLVARAKLD